jgi:hypothetical protein
MTRFLRQAFGIEEATMITLDHLVYATPDVVATSAWIAEQLGVTPEVGGRHVGRGTHNTLLSLGGSSYLEIIGPDSDAPPPDGPRPFGVDDITRPTLVTWAASVAAHTLASVIDEARLGGYDPGDSIAMQRNTPSGQLLSWALTVSPASPNGDLVRVVPFLIDWLDTPSAAHPSSTSPPGCIVDHLAIGHPQPEKVRSMLSALGIEQTVEHSSFPFLRADISGPSGTVRLS